MDIDVSARFQQLIDEAKEKHAQFLADNAIREIQGLEPIKLPEFPVTPGTKIPTDKRYIGNSKDLFKLKSFKLKKKDKQ